MAKETEKKKKHVRIRHTLNGGKHRVCGTRYRLDGYDEESMTAYEFLGEFFFYDIYIYNIINTTYEYMCIESGCGRVV
jgi:hypothetical protein